MTKEITNNADILDVRDIIAQFEELENELTVTKDGESTKAELLELDSWIDEIDISRHPFQETIEQYKELKHLLEELKGKGGDEQWRGDWYPVTMIRDRYFEEAMDELLEDIGDMPKNIPSYLKITVDYNALQMDYTSVDYDGVTYWYR